MCDDSKAIETDYFVVWEFDATASTPQEAARLARDAQTRPGTTATVFRVFDANGDEVQVDLTALDEGETPE
jgi:hypothetical protein